MTWVDEVTNYMGESGKSAVKMIKFLRVSDEGQMVFLWSEGSLFEKKLI